MENPDLSKVPFEQEPSHIPIHQKPYAPTLGGAEKYTPFPSSPSNQIFLHPDHEKLTRPKSSLSRNSILISIAILISLLIGSAFWFFVLPKSETVRFAKSSKELVSTASEKTDLLNKSLTTLYEAQSKQESAVTFSKNFDNSDIKFIASLATQDHIINSYDLFQSAQYFLNKKPDQVKGFSTPSSDPNKTSRNRRDLAVDISRKAKEAVSTNQKLQTLLKNVPAGAAGVKKDLTTLSDDLNVYFQESTKTSDYYVAVADASIELTNLAQANSIDKIINEIDSLKSKFENYKTNKKLPSEMDKFNSDLVEILDVLASLYREEKKAVSDKSITQAYLLNKYSARYNSAINASLADEISFWKNNKILSGYESLSADQTETLKKISDLKDQNNFFLLEWMGVQ